MTYAVHPLLDPATGNPSLDAFGAVRMSDSPAREMVLIALRTQLGACPVDPDLGVDWRRVDKLRTSARADAETVIRAGLQRLVRRGDIASLAVVAKVAASTGTLTYTVSFVDVLATSQAALTVTGTRTV